MKLWANRLWELRKKGIQTSQLSLGTPIEWHADARRALHFAGYQKGNTTLLEPYSLGSQEKTKIPTQWCSPLETAEGFWKELVFKLSHEKYGNLPLYNCHLRKYMLKEGMKFNTFIRSMVSH